MCDQQSTQNSIPPCRGGGLHVMAGVIAIVCVALAVSFNPATTAAQQPGVDRATSGWSTNTAGPSATYESAQPQSGTAEPGNLLPNLDVLNNNAGSAPAAATIPQVAMISLEAFLTSEADVARQRPIDRGLVWRIFSISRGTRTAELLATSRDATPNLELPPGRYAINAAFGRANLTETVNLQAGQQTRQSFVLNAGGLRVIAKVSGNSRLEDTNARFDIFSDERDQSGERRRIVTNARPGLITRLNSGIYHIVSRLGDANAKVEADVGVEAGKLTEAVVNHEAARVTLKLVQNAAGEAQAAANWIIMTKGGDIVKETAGALPTHMLAPGSYTVSARLGGQLFTRTFEVASGDNVEVEVVMQ